MSSNVLDISLDWEERDGDGTRCSACKEPAFYKMHVLVVRSGNEKDDSKWRLCDSCYNLPDE